jgi:hypothetical protein
MVYTTTQSSFPDQVVPDAEKDSLDYGLQVGRAIEGEWWDGAGSNWGNTRYGFNYANFHRLRLYARGEQSIQKYKDELAINGDLSYLNIDWKPIPVIPKFVDIVVNGMSQRNHEIKAYSQDPGSIRAKTQFASNVMQDMQQQEENAILEEVTGINFAKSQLGKEKILPESKEELELYLQLNYKQQIEISQEELINNFLDKNKYQLIKRRLIEDLTIIGIAATKTSFNQAEGITVDYVDPANIVYSYTEDPNFEDLYYVGEVKNISLPELKKEFPYLTAEDLKEIQAYNSNHYNYTHNYDSNNDDNTVQVIYFEYKTFKNQVFKIKQTDFGLEKAIEKTDEFNPPESDNFKKAFRAIEVLYSGAKILGHDKMLKWELAENMTRPYADTTKVQMNYSICAPKMYKGRIESLVSRITSFADMIQLTHLKLQQVMSRMVPDGVYLDVDGLAEVDLGNGTNYNPAEALNMYFQTGSIVGRSLTQDGDLNRGKVPIQELQTSSGQAKIASLINTYQYYLQMIRDVTGLNEARDGSTPDKDALVGIQKLAAANSNTATRHILQASLYLTLKTCENISLRVSDAIKFPLTYSSLIHSINPFNVEALEEIKDKNIFDFGIYLELEPDEEEQAKLEQNIQIALQSGSIDLEDAIDIRNIKNIDLANQAIKLKRRKKEERMQAAQQANIQAQAQANAQAAEAAALAEVQKQQALNASKVELEKAKAGFELEKLRTEASLKQQLMQVEFDFNMQLTQAREGAKKTNEEYKEDRKDERTKIQATQQSELIEQRKGVAGPKNFESAGFDTMGGFGLEQFDPK